jgi:hypothetical protein
MSQPVKLFTFVCLLLGMAVVSGGQPTTMPAKTASAPTKITVGGQDLLIPAPDEFAEASQDALEAHQALLKATVPNNELFCLFIPAAETKNPGAGEPGKISRYAMVQAMRSLENHNFTDAEFAAVKTAVAGPMDQQAEKIKDDINENLKALSSPDKKSRVELSKPLMLGTFLKVDDAIGFLMVLKAHVDDGHGQVTDSTLAGATVIQKVKDRVVYFYVYAPYTDESTLKSVREASTQWSQKVRAAN